MYFLIAKRVGNGDSAASRTVCPDMFRDSVFTYIFLDNAAGVQIRVKDWI